MDSTDKPERAGVWIVLAVGLGWAAVMAGYVLCLVAAVG